MIVDIALGLAKVVPSIVGLFGDDKDEEMAKKVVGIAEAVTGKKGETATKALEANPQLALEFKKGLLKDSQVHAQIGADILATINETMRVEAKSDKWWVSGWRPFIGFVTGIAFLVVTFFVCLLTWEAIDSKDQNAMQMIPQVIFNFTTLFGIPGAILGIASHHRGKKQREQSVK